MIKEKIFECQDFDGGVAVRVVLYDIYQALDHPTLSTFWTIVHIIIVELRLIVGLKFREIGMDPNFNFPFFCKKNHLFLDFKDAIFLVK